MSFLEVAKVLLGSYFAVLAVWGERKEFSATKKIWFPHPLVTPLFELLCMARIYKINFLKLQTILSIWRIKNTTFARPHNFHPVKKLKGIFRLAEMYFTSILCLYPLRSRYTSLPPDLYIHYTV